MNWTLSEFLNLLELRSQSWCFVDMRATGGFKVPHGETIQCYVALDGAVRICGVGGGTLDLAHGDGVMIVSGEAHAVRSNAGNVADILPFFGGASYVDTPPTIGIGSGASCARLLAGRLKVRWPGGMKPRMMPASVDLRAALDIVNLDALVAAARGSGAAALLTHAATLLLMAALRDDPECNALFDEARFNDPIGRATQIIQVHPREDWTVERLARKVGMGRSSFAAKFVAETGVTPIEALTRERMRQAASLLSNSDLKIAAIGESVGYRSEAAFSRRFSEHFGYPPGRMRRGGAPVRPAAPPRGRAQGVGGGFARVGSPG